MSENDWKPFKYEGDLDDLSRPHGNGVGNYNGTQLYNGTYEHGFKDGIGTYRYSENEFYTGSWKKGKREGFGIYIYPDKSIYKGNWQDNCRHGEGVMKYKNGNAYFGEWFEGDMDGKGLYYFKAINTLILSFWKSGLRNKEKDVILSKDLINLEKDKKEEEDEMEKAFTYLNERNTIKKPTQHLDEEKIAEEASTEDLEKVERAIGDKVNEAKDDTEIQKDIQMYENGRETEGNIAGQDRNKKLSKNEILILEQSIRKNSENIGKGEQVADSSRNVSVVTAVKDESEFLIELIKKKVKDTENNVSVEKNIKNEEKVNDVIMPQPETKLPSSSEVFEGEKTKKSMDLLEISIKEEIMENKARGGENILNDSIVTTVKDDSNFVIELVKKKKESDRENAVTNVNETMNLKVEDQDE